MRAPAPLSARPFRQGAVLGLTLAEAFVLIAFALLLLLALGSVEQQAQEERLAPLEGLSDAQVEAAARLAREMAPETAPETPAPETPAEDPWRLIDSDELRRVVDGLAALPPDLQADLADLVEVEDGAALARLLALSRRAGADEETRLAAIGATLDAARAERAALVADLRDRLGGTVAAVGGTIEPDGSVVLPDAVLFEQGSATLTPTLAGFLDGFCEPWLAELQGAAAVASARVEGHASSEWRGDTRPEEAYLNNLALSQARAQAVLEACLRRAQAPGTRDWAQRHLAAVGYSSGRPVLLDGAEDRERSRRVVFSVATDEGALLREVEDAARGEAPAP